MEERMPFWLLKRTGTDNLKPGGRSEKTFNGLKKKGGVEGCHPELLENLSFFSIRGIQEAQVPVHFGGQVRSLPNSVYLYGYPDSSCYLPSAPGFLYPLL